MTRDARIFVAGSLAGALGGAACATVWVSPVAVLGAWAFSAFLAWLLFGLLIFELVAGPGGADEGADDEVRDRAGGGDE